jgi:hypothetical protein
MKEQSLLLTSILSPKERGGFARAGRGWLARLNVLIHTEEIIGIVFLFDRG